MYMFVVSVIYVHMYVYMHGVCACMCKCVHVSICICLFVYLCISVHMRMLLCVYAQMCVCEYVYESIRVYMHINMYMCMLVWTYGLIYKHTCRWTCKFKWTCEGKGICKYGCLCRGMCICLCVCIYVHIYLRPALPQRPWRNSWPQPRINWTGHHISQQWRQAHASFSNQRGPRQRWCHGCLSPLESLEGKAQLVWKELNGLQPHSCSCGLLRAPTALREDCAQVRSPSVCPRRSPAGLERRLTISWLVVAASAAPLQHRALIQCPASFPTSCSVQLCEIAAVLEVPSSLCQEVRFVSWLASCPISSRASSLELQVLCRGPAFMSPLCRQHRDVVC